MIQIKNLKIKVLDKQILNWVSLNFELGKNYLLLWKNGSWKSSLSSFLMWNPVYEYEGWSVEITEGQTQGTAPTENSRGEPCVHPEKFPEQKTSKKAKISDILQKDSNREKLDKSKYSWYKENISKKETTVKKWILEWYTTFNSENYVYHKDWLAPTVTASWAQSRIKFFWDDWEIYFLNSLEHLLLQWFDKEFYKKLKKLDFTETKIKFLAWNSINVKVLEKIFAFYLK